MIARNTLIEFFSDDEVRRLAVEMGVDHELPGRTASLTQLVEALLEQLANAREKIPEFVELVKRERPARDLSGFESAIENYRAKPADRRTRAILRSKARGTTSKRPALMLDPGSQLVPFDSDGRADELLRLTNFTGADDVFAALVVCGPGGTGKTRLLVEWCKRVESRGWIAGFLPRNIHADDIESLVEGDLPRFVVIDYVETTPERASQLLEAIVERSRNTKIRVVLVAREVGSWFVKLRTNPHLDEYLSRWDVLRLADLYSTEDDAHRGFDAARVAYYRHLGQSGSLPEVPRGGVSLLPEAGDDDLRRALYVHMRALLSVLESNATCEDFSAEELLGRILAHEQDYWSRWVENACGRSTKPLLLGLERAAAALVLCGPSQNPQAAKQLFLEATPDLGDSRVTTIVDCFSELYEEEAESEFILSIGPSLLGEHLLSKVLARLSEEERRRWSSIPLRPKASRLEITFALIVLTRLARASKDRGCLNYLLTEYGEDLVRRVVKTANEGSPAPPGPVLADAIQQQNDPDTARIIASALPESIELAEVNECVYRVVVTDAESCLDAEPGRFATLLCKWGAALSGVGEYEKALEVTHRAIGLLVNNEQIADLLDPAWILSNLGCYHSELGDIDVAAQTTRDAVEIYRTYNEDDRSELIGALSNLGVHLSASGKLEEALNSCQEAVELGCKLEEGGVVSSTYARVLLNLGAVQFQAGEREAVQTVESAVSRYTVLASREPDRYTDMLATSKLTQGAILCQAELLERSFEALTRAVELLELLAQRRPQQFEEHLALALLNLCRTEIECGRREPALHAARRSVEIYERLANERPHVHKVRLGLALNNFGTAEVDLGRVNISLTRLERAISLLRELLVDRPTVYQHHLGMALTNYGYALNLQRRRAEALSALRESVALYRKCTENQHRNIGSDLARSLLNLGQVLCETGSYSEAIDVLREACSAYFKRAKGGVSLRDLARGLINYALIFYSLGDYDAAFRRVHASLMVCEALEKPREARELEEFLPQVGDLMVPGSKRADTSSIFRVEYFARMRETRPEAAHRRELSRALHLYSAVLRELGHEGAYEVAVEAVAQTRVLYEVSPETFRYELACTLTELAEAQRERGQVKEGLATLKENLELLEICARERPGVFEAEIAMTNCNLGLFLGDDNQHDKGVTHSELALRQFQELRETERNCHRLQYAIMLQNAGIVLGQQERNEEALEKYLEAEDVYRRHASSAPLRCQAGLVTVGLMRSGVLLSLGRAEEVSPIIRHITEEASILAARWPKRFHAIEALTSVLNSFVVVDEEMSEETFRIIVDSAEKLCAATDGCSPRLLPVFPMCLAPLHEFFVVYEEYDNALMVARKWVFCCRRLMSLLPSGNALKLAQSLIELGATLYLLERFDQSREPLREALTLLNELRRSESNANKLAVKKQLKVARKLRDRLDGKVGRRRNTKKRKVPRGKRKRRRIRRG